MSRRDRARPFSLSGVFASPLDVRGAGGSPAPFNLPVVNTPVIAPAGTATQPVIEAHRYARWIPGSLMLNAAAAVPTASFKALQESGNFRNLLVMRNTSATMVIAVEFEAESSINSVLLLQPGQILGWDDVVPQGDMWCSLIAAGVGFHSLSFAYSVIQG